MVTNSFAAISIGPIISETGLWGKQKVSSLEFFLLRSPPARFASFDFAQDRQVGMVPQVRRHFFLDKSWVILSNVV